MELEGSGKKNSGASGSRRTQTPISSSNFGEKSRGFRRPPSRTGLRSSGPPPSTTASPNAVAKEQSPRNLSSQAAEAHKLSTSLCSSAAPVSQAGSIDLTIQQAKKYAVAQAQQDGCTGSFRSFDSPFGNYLLPVIPNVADLNK